ncbi:hypothetical protein SLEP1_g52434 [Rubroshorea leprosula]|uniref:Uncharacterized protein n=1 Tax=Rubroshorea leprosula TaxID=152421 RepID=A0AAV5M6E2_9ROSI|nr:hypothetical protein SLEP1_g52434 [Rubroshorea leprosula]
MDAFEIEGHIQHNPKAEDLKHSGDNSSEYAVFDASQYAFFGKDFVEEVELGGLEDEEEDLHVAELHEEEFLFEREEGEVSRSLSDVDDLTSSFSKLSNAVSGPKNFGMFGDEGSRENLPMGLQTGLYPSLKLYES